MYYSSHYASPIGELTLASDGTSLTGLWIYGQKHFAQRHIDPVEAPELPVFREVTAWLDRYFAGLPVLPLDLPLSPTGTVFQQRVWNILLRIPPGQTVTYGQIAKLLDIPRSAQAVGSAVGRNPISIIIPCHRVLGSDGSLTGYAGGLPAKLWLLKHEGIHPNTVTDPVFPGIVL